MVPQLATYKLLPTCLNAARRARLLFDFVFRLVRRQIPGRTTRVSSYVPRRRDGDRATDLDRLQRFLGLI